MMTKSKNLGLMKAYIKFLKDRLRTQTDQSRNLFAETSTSANKQKNLIKPKMAKKKILTCLMEIIISNLITMT